jgi:mannose-6-phosphate isomerase-like protein (cupin superfamily)
MEADPDCRVRKEHTLSYPEPIYRGEGGETTAWHRPFDADPDIVYPNGNTAHYLVTGGQSDGLLGMYQWNMGPEPSGPSPHFHRSFSESFFVLSGSVLIFDGNEWIETRPGSYVYAPPGALHGFRNESGEQASMLILFAPGAPRETYFEGLLKLGEMTTEEQVEFIQYHDQWEAPNGS